MITILTRLSYFYAIFYFHTQLWSHILLLLSLRNHEPPIWRAMTVYALLRSARRAIRTSEFVNDLAVLYIKFNMLYNILLHPKNAKAGLPCLHRRKPTRLLHESVTQKSIDVLLGWKFLLFWSLMLAITVYELLYKMQASREELCVKNPLFLNEIESNALHGLLNTLDELWSSGGRYFSLMKYGLMVIDIQKLTLCVKSVKNETLFVSLSIINVKKNECFETIFMAVQRVFMSFKRRNEGLYLKKHTVHILYPLLMIRCILTQIKSWFLYRMRPLSTQ